MSSHIYASKRFAFHSQGIYILRQHKHVPSKQWIWSFLEFLFLFYILYPPAAWTWLPIRRNENLRHSRSFELSSSFLLKFFYISKIISLFQNYSPLCCLIYLLPLCSSSSTLFYSLYCPQKLSLLSFRLLILPPQRVRCFSKTFSADLIRSRIRRFATLIEHASSMLAAAISIPTHSSKESHAIFMQYWWGAVTPSQLIHSHPEL